jgi:uncharacterized protein YecT (DUF1311 family)
MQTTGVLGFRRQTTASLGLLLVLLTSCSQEASQVPVSTSKVVAATAAPARVPAAESAPLSVARERECAARQVLWPYCYTDGWGGNTPSNEAMYASPSSKQRWDGLAHVLEHGELRRVQLMYDKTTGSCGEVVVATGNFQGSTYSGTFYCNKSQTLTVASDLPDKTNSDQNFLLGKWNWTVVGKDDKPAIWEFLPDGSMLQGQKKYDYKFFGPAFAIREAGESTWWVSKVLDSGPHHLQFKNSEPDGIGSTTYALARIGPPPQTQTTVPVSKGPETGPASTLPVDPALPKIVQLQKTPDSSRLAAAREEPSFDCAKASTVNENLICSDPELARLDRELAGIYQRAKDAATDPGAFAQESRAAFHNRETRCADRSCLAAWYMERKERLVVAQKTSGR